MVIRLNGWMPHQVREMPVAAGQRRVLRRAAACRRARRGSRRAASPVAAQSAAAGVVAAGGGHLGQREEEHLQAGEVVVAVGLEQGAAACCRRSPGELESGSFSTPSASGLSRARRHSPISRHNGIGAVAQERVVAGVAPVQVEEVGVPGAHRGREAVLAPAAERLAGQAHHAGHRGAGRVVELPGELAERGQQIPEVSRGSTRLRRSRRTSGRRCRSSGC